MELGNALKENNIDKAQQILKACLQLEDELQIGYGFRMVCAWNRLELAKWLLSMHPSMDIDAHELAFQWACERGHLEMAKWLFIAGDLTHANEPRDGVFYRACENGYLDTARWLVSVDPSINIHKKNERAFVLACRNNHLDVAKWLVSAYPSIVIPGRGGVAFVCACERGHLEVGRWLLTLYPTFEVWYKDSADRLRVWSAPRDAWIRAVVLTRLCNFSKNSL